MLKIAIGLALLAHGIGHSMGLLGLSKIASVNPGWHGDSWILTGAAGTTLTNAVGVVIWTIAIVGFTAVAGVVFGLFPESWFAPLAVGSSLVSLAGIVLFPIAFPIFSTIGALAVNVAVLAAVLWYQWVPSDLTS